MFTKLLFIALTTAAFSSCSAVYKTGQTPDDVYYSQGRLFTEQQSSEDKEILMGIRDPRWRDFYTDYNYVYSPYYFSTCYSNYGYYYNPYYHPWPVYNTIIIPVNSTPRMVNLNTYTGFNNNVISNSKTGIGINWVRPSVQYNNSNRLILGNSRQVITPTYNNNNSTPSNNTRTYTPSSSGSSNNSGSVSRPGRGG